MSKNLIAEQSVINKLMQNDYLHSNTDNFIENTRNLINFKQQQQVDNFDDLMKELSLIISKCLVRVNNMYKFLGIKGRDSWSSSGGYNSAGASEFKRKFLIKEFLGKESKGRLSFGQKLLTIINSQESLDFLQRNFSISSADMISIDDEEKILLKLLQKITGKWMKNIENTTGTLVDNFIDRLFDTKNGRIRIHKTKNSKQEDLDELMNKLKLYGLNLNHKEDVLKLKSAIKTQLFRKNYYKILGDKYYDFISDRFLYYFKDNSDFIKIKREVFIKEFVDTLKGYTSIDFEKNGSTSNLKGFLLEFGFYADYKLGKKKIQRGIKILGQDLEKRVYKNTQKDMSNEKVTNEIEGEKKIFTSQSASDIVFYNDKQEYRLQLKNNLLDKEFLSFRAQPEIKISTFLPNAIKDENTRNTLSYLLINFGFLKKYGLDKEGQPNHISEKDIPEIKDYITLLLETGYKFILGTDYMTKVDEAEVQEAGNIAYIFQGKFLIPVAMYFASAYELLYKLQTNSADFRNSGIGGLSLPSYTNISNEIFSNSQNSLNEIQFQNQKHKIIQKMKYNDNMYGEYRYPQQLLEYGAVAGHDMYNKMSFKLRITLSLDKLKNLLDKKL